MTEVMENDEYPTEPPPPPTSSQLTPRSFPAGSAVPWPNEIPNWFWEAVNVFVEKAGELMRSRLAEVQDELSGVKRQITELTDESRTARVEHMAELAMLKRRVDVLESQLADALRELADIKKKVEP